MTCVLFTNLPRRCRPALSNNALHLGLHLPNCAEEVLSNGLLRPRNNARGVSTTSLPKGWPTCSTLYTFPINKVGQCCRPCPLDSPIDASQDPIYVSEVAERAMNPNFRNIHLDSADPQLLRLDGLILKFWAKSEAMSQYCLLIDMTLSMRSLQFIGKTVGLLHTFPSTPNADLLHPASELPSSVST